MMSKDTYERFYRSLYRIRRVEEEIARIYPSDKINAQSMIASAAAGGEVLTGLLYLAPDSEDLHGHLNTYEQAFNTLGEKELCPGSAMLEKINAGLR